MADVDMEFDARQLDTWDLLGEKAAIFYTPDFQRPFEWQKEQFEDLWLDIQSSIGNGNNHFLGQVILIEGDPSENAVADSFKHIGLIDGQQRLTTVSIMMCAMRDVYLDRNPDRNDLNPITDVITARDANDNRERRLRLLNEQSDDDNYNMIYSGEVERAEGALKECYDYYKKKFDSLDTEEINQVRSLLLNDVYLIRTECGDLASAYQIFQTQNDRGKDLSPIHLCKSILFEAVAKSENDEQYVKRKWLEIKQRLDDIDRAGAKRPISHILAISEYDSPLQMFPKQFVRTFYDVIRVQLKENGETPVDFIEYLDQESKIYENANNYTVTKFPNHIRNGINIRLQNFRINNPHGGILAYWLVRNIDDHNELARLLDISIKLNARVNLSELTAAKARDPMYTAVRRLREADNRINALRKVVQDKTPSDASILESVKDHEFRASKFTKFVLSVLERDHFSNKQHKNEPISVDGVQVEHIAPRSTFDSDQYKPWESVLGHDPHKFERYKNKIGNVTIMAESQNARAGDDPFDIKSREYQASEYNITKKLAEFDRWGYEEIDARTEELADLVVKSFTVDET